MGESECRAWSSSATGGDGFKRSKRIDPLTYQRIMDDEGIQAKFASDLARKKDYGGLGQRTDLEEWLGIGAKHRVRGVMDRMKNYGYEGLPVVAGGAAMPVILGNGSSSDGP